MSVAGPGWEFYWTEVYHEMHLHEREMRTANAAGQPGREPRPDATSDSLRTQARDVFNKLITDPARYSQDPAGTANILRRTAANMALDRMLTSPAGFRLDTVDDPVPHLRIHAAPEATAPESFDLRLVDETGLSAIPGHFSIHVRTRGDVPRSDTRHDFPAVIFDHAAHLLMQEVRKARQEAPLVEHAETTLKEVLNAPDAHGADTSRTHARLLRFTALLAASRMLSHRSGIRHADLPWPERHVRLFLPEDRHPPETLEIRLKPVPEPR